MTCEEKSPMSHRQSAFASVFVAAVLAAGPGAAFAANKILSCGTIKEPGSYLLGKNLAATGDCLVVVVNDVTIDLDGYTIRGNGTGSGILAVENGNIAVRNGSITGFNTMNLNG